MMAGKKVRSRLEPITDDETGELLGYYDPAAPKTDGQGRLVVRFNPATGVVSGAVEELAATMPEEPGPGLRMITVPRPE